MIVNCPSGLVVDLRKLKVQEANILADKQAQQKGATLDRMLAGVWQETLDVGPYTFSADKPIDWEQVLTGDRFYAQLQVRCATHGPEYDFRIPCQVCKASIDWSVNLTDLPLKKLRPEDAAVFTQGNKFEDLGPDGRQYKFHLMTGVHEKQAQKLFKGNPTQRITASLLARIDSIEGVEDRLRHLGELDFTVGLDLIAMLDSHDCGVETSFFVECQECSANSEVQLPLEQAGYWAPSRKTTKRAI